MAPRGKDRPEGNAPENVKKRKKTKASSNLGITTSPPHAPASSHVPPPTCPLSFPPPLYSIPHLGYKAPSSTPFFNPTSSQNIPGLRPGVPSLSTYLVMSSSSSPVIPSFSSSGIQSSFSPIVHSSSSSSMPSLFSQPARYSSMPSSKSTPLSHGIPSSSYSFLPSSSSPVIHSSSSTGMPSSFSHPTRYSSMPSSESTPHSHGIPSSSSSGMFSSFSQPASHSSMPLSGSTPSSSPSISMAHIGVNSNSTFQYTDGDTATQPPAQTSTRSQDPPNVGKYDDLRRLIIVSDGAGFYPPRATKAVVESMCSFYHAPYRFWSEVPTNIRDRMFAEFRLKCAWARDSEAEVRAVFFKKCSDRFPDLLRTARESNTRPNWIIDDLWLKLLEYWNSPEFKKKSEQGKAARLSNKGGSVHTGGSISVGAHRRRLENAKGRPVTHDEVFEETHMKKLKDGTKTTWIEPRAETTNDNFKRILEEFIQSQPTDDQGRPIQPTQEEIMDMWIKAAGGVHKGRVYGLGSEFSLGRRTSGLSGSYSSSYCSVDLDEFEQLNRKVAEMTELYLQERAVRQEEAKRREEEDRLREEEMRRKDDALRLVTSDVKSLKSQINSLLESGAFPVPRSPLSDDN